MFSDKYIEETLRKRYEFEALPKKERDIKIETNRIKQRKKSEEEINTPEGLYWQIGKLNEEKTEEINTPDWNIRGLKEAINEDKNKLIKPWNVI